MSQHIDIQDDMQPTVHAQEAVNCFEHQNSCCEDALKNMGELKAGAHQTLTKPELKERLVVASIKIEAPWANTEATWKTL